MTPLWKICGDRVEAPVGTYRWQLHRAVPALRLVSADGRDLLSGSVLGPGMPAGAMPSADDWNVREREVAGRWQQVPGPDMICHGSWRVLDKYPAGVTGGMQFDLSVNTLSLDSRLQMCVTAFCQDEAIEGWDGHRWYPLVAGTHAGISAYSFRSTDWAYVEVSDPSDVVTLQVERLDGEHRVIWNLFDEFLEKGVIRQARLHGFILPAANPSLRAACLDAIVTARRADVF